MVDDTAIPKGFLDDRGADGDDGRSSRDSSQAREREEPIENS
jgi:hypothetical protein